MRLILRLLIATAVLLIVGVVIFLLWSQQPEIASIGPPARSAFPRDLIETGSQLAAIGNCDVCYTTQGGPAFAGSRPISTPFGTIYSTNITPDPETGIGQWSETSFDRAMRDGIARDGHHLYPAFPYDHFACPEAAICGGGERGCSGARSRLNPAPENFGDAPCLGDAAARHKRRFGVEDFADGADSGFDEMRPEPC
jgi:hypothetical protein